MALRETEDRVGVSGKRTIWIVLSWSEFFLEAARWLVGCALPTVWVLPRLGRSTSRLVFESP